MIQARRVVAKFLFRDDVGPDGEAELLYQGFVEHPAYKKMPKMFPNYISGQAEDATDYLMKEHKNLDKDILKRVREKIHAGIT
jgi:hypothetical protein